MEPQNVPLQPPSTEPVLPKAHRSFFFPLIIGGIVIIFVGLIGGFYFGKRQMSQPPISVSPTITVPTIPISQIKAQRIIIPNKTDNWKTYSDKNNIFTFKYPPILSECCGIAGPATGKAVRVVTFGDVPVGAPGSDGPFNGLAVYVDDASQASFSTYIEAEIQALINQATVIGNYNGKGYRENVKIGDMNGVLLQGYSWDSIERYYVEVNNKIVEISKIKKAGNFDQTFNHILSTFKFLD